MNDTTKQLMQLMADLGVISERMDEKNRRIEELQAKIKELKQEVHLACAIAKAYRQGRDDAHQTIVALQAKSEEMTADLERVRGHLDSERKTAKESIAMLRTELKEWKSGAQVRGWREIREGK